MSVQKQKQIVQYVSDDYIVVIYDSKAIKEEFTKIGGKRSIINWKNWLISYSSEGELAKLFNTLRDLGFVFTGGHSGWPPSAIFSHLRDRGLIEGEFTEVVWPDPQKDSIYTKK